MQTETNDLQPPTNHIFVDFENVHEVDLAIIGSKAVHLTLLLGSRQTKLDAALVEKLIQHADTVELIRLKSSGRNALDFSLAYYLGRAVLADPGGYFHIVSKDAGYEPLIEHLRSKHVCAHRHDDFTKLTFSGPAKPRTPTSPAVASESKFPSKPKAQPPIVDEWETRVLEHFRKASAQRPRNHKKLVSFLVAFFGQKISEGVAMDRIEKLGQAGHLGIDGKGIVTYHLDSR